jgi:predicted amidophosphoribosyltransferase
MGQRNPAFRRATDGRLLDFKDNIDDGITNAVADFSEVLAQLELPEGTILVVVPGHEARQSNAGRPLARAAERLADLDNARYIASVDSLIRMRTVSKLATGGDRDVEIQLESMMVREPPRLARATVVILDDTVAKGGTTQAARQLVQNAGAARVAVVALGRTVKYL